jgi:hypothetical protein
MWRGLLAGLLRQGTNWRCWLGQHRWQAWFELKICSRCEQVGFRQLPRA